MMARAPIRCRQRERGDFFLTPIPGKSFNSRTTSFPDPLHSRDYNIVAIIFRGNRWSNVDEELRYKS
jgi:hypothetical protein